MTSSGVDFRVASAVLDRAMRGDGSYRDLIAPAWDRMTSLISSATSVAWLVSVLTPGQLALLSTHLLDCEVRNGGFRQFLQNSSGSLAREARDGFLRFGAGRTAQLIDEVLARLSGGYSSDHAYRRTSLDRMRGTVAGIFTSLDRRYYALANGPEPLWTLVESYVDSHSSEFVRDP